MKKYNREIDLDNFRSVTLHIHEEFGEAVSCLFDFQAEFEYAEIKVLFHRYYDDINGCIGK